jgi:hypothetical protein
MDAGFNALNLTIFYQNAIDHGLSDIQAGLRFDDRLHPPAVKITIILGPRPLDSKTFSGVQASELYARLIGIFCHFAAHGVNLFDKMAFGQTSDGRVTAHGGNVVHVYGQKQGEMSHTSRGECRFTPCMTGADHDHIVFFVVREHRRSA